MTPDAASSLDFPTQRPGGTPVGDRSTGTGGDNPAPRPLAGNAGAGDAA